MNDQERFIDVLLQPVDLHAINRLIKLSLQEPALSTIGKEDFILVRVQGVARGVALDA